MSRSTCGKLASGEGGQVLCLIPLPSLGSSKHVVCPASVCPPVKQDANNYLVGESECSAAHCTGQWVQALACSWVTACRGP